MVRHNGQYSKRMYSKHIGKVARMHRDEDSEDSEDEDEEEEEEIDEPAPVHQPVDEEDEEEEDDEDDDEGYQEQQPVQEEEEEVEDEEEEEEEEEDEEEEPRQQKRKASAFIDEEADEEDEEEEEENYNRAGKKSRSEGASLFVDDIAEDDEGEEEDEEEEVEDGFFEEREEANAAEVQNQHRQAMQAQQQFGESEEDLEEYIKSRYSQIDEKDGDFEGTEVEHQANLPTVKDPKLWLVQVRIGKEREAVVQLIQKQLNIQQSGKGELMAIKSALSMDHLKGWIYLEAEKEIHVRTACTGLRNFFTYKGFKLVPIGEMTEVMSIKPKHSASLRPESFVRIRNGVYKDDLAQVLDVFAAENKAEVKIIPRIDYQALKEKAKDAGLERYVHNKADRQGQYFDFLDTLKFLNGYLVKQVSISSCKVEETPSFDDLQRFQSGSTDDADEMDGQATSELAKLTKQVTMQRSEQQKFKKGDCVVVNDGDLKNLMGTVDSITAEGEVIVAPKLRDITELISFPANQLNKFFKRGDHVKVTAGRHEGDSGMVVHVEDLIATVFTDTTQEEIKVFTYDLVECLEESTGNTTFGQFELFDLVALDAATVGVIIKVDREACRVLTNNSLADRPDVRVCRLPDIKKKISLRRNTAQDKNMAPVTADDIVDVPDGPLKGKTATVHHVFKGLLFAKSREVMENGGFVCLKARNVVAPHRGPTPPEGGRGRFSGSDRGPKRDLGLIGQRLKIKGGPYKGYQGKVLDATDSTVRIELEAMFKTITVKMADLRVPNSAPGGDPYDSSRGTPGANSWQTPGSQRQLPPQTPSHFGAHMQTPLRDGSQTPMHDGGSRTPHRGDSAWNPSGTPQHVPGWQTDNSPAVGTPGGTPSAPVYGAVGTPGGGYDRGGAAGTPGAYTPYDTYTDTNNTPSDHNPGTPGSGYNSMYSSGQAQTPGGDMAYTPTDDPMSPSPSIGNEPMSPGASNYGGAAELQPFKGLVVDMSEGSEEAIVKEIDGDLCIVEDSSGVKTEVPLADLQVVAPVKWDHVKVVRGADCGLEAELIGMDGADGVLRMKDERKTIKILDLNTLGRIHKDYVGIA
eukprot:gene9613-11391_t